MTSSMVQRVMCAVPGLRWLYHIVRRLQVFRDPERAAFLTTFPPGHYYSPLPTMADASRALAEGRDRAWVEASGVDLRDAEQVALLHTFAAYSDSIPFGETPGAGACRFSYGNTWFDACDAIVLHCMIRHLRPSRLFEVGCGYSSAVSLDTSDRFLDPPITFTFVEPNPDRLDQLLRDSDRARVTVVNRPIWEIPLHLLDDLRAGDIFFIDTSHVVKVASDVHFLLFTVLPRLAPGVIIHVHDIFWPFEYPADWFAMGRAYNEIYLMQALLMGGNRFEVLFFNHYMQETHRDLFDACLPVASRSRGSSLWLRKRA